jgi:hypothetical protein
MLAHNLKGILTLIPEALELVKKANLEEEFPLDSADSASASYLRAHYLDKVAGKRIDPDQMKLIKKAVSLYGTKDTLDKLIPKFDMSEKRAAEALKPMPVKVAEANFEGDLGGYGFLSIEKTASAAEDLLNTYTDSITSPDVLRYSGKAYLNKEAAINALGNRYFASKNPEYVKLARDVMSITDNNFSQVNPLCKTVSSMDKVAGLDIIGFNFYREALIVKKAEYEKKADVNLAGQDVPYSKVLAFGKDGIASTLGADIAGSMTDCPVHNKAVLESLPRDLQIMLLSIFKSV